jgi:protein-tyrosine phosphatase
MTTCSEIFQGLYIGGMPHADNQATAATWLRSELPGYHPALPLPAPDSLVVVTCMPLQAHEATAIHALVGARMHDFSFTDDIQPPSIREMGIVRDAVAMVRHHRARHAPVVVLCREGKNRSGLVVAASIVSLYAWTAQSAIDRVRDRRPGALYNTFFTDALLRKELP